MSSVLLRALLFGGVWWLLTSGEVRSWLVGLPVVAASTMLSMRLTPPGNWRVSPAGLAAFVPYFLWRSFRGSIDVAWRALHPRLPIAPSFSDYPLHLPADGPFRVFFADTVNLLPGTLNVALHDGAMTVHFLTGASPDAVAELQRLERRVGALFGIRLRIPAGGGDPADA